MSDVMSITVKKLGAGNKLLVLRMDGREQLGALPEWHVDLVGNVNLLGMRESIDLHALLGSPATVTIKHGVERYFNAFITEAERGERHGRYDSYRITLRPWLWFATRTRNSRVFQGKTVKEIVDAVLKPYDGDIKWDGINASLYKPLEYCVQYEESDFDFVSRLLEEFGIYYFFKHTDAAHTMMMVDAMAKHEGKTVVQWASKLDTVKPTVIDWKLVEEVHSVKAVVRDYDYLATALAIEQERSALPTSATAKLGDAEVYEFPARAVQNQVKPDAQGSAEAASLFAKVRLEQLQSLQQFYTGTTNCNDIVVGYKFTLEDALNAADNDDYLVVGTTFQAEFGDHEAIDDLPATSRRRDGIVINMLCINMGGNPFRSPRRTARPIMYGPQTAVVVGSSGNEVETDKHGRIKVQFHWDRLGKKNENSSCFLRVSQPWAGKGMGLWMLPRVGHEVVVSFIGGDPDRPLVTGSVHNDVNTPIYPLPANSDISGWRTHSTKGGGAEDRHELRFDDKMGKEYVWLQSQKTFHRHVKENAFDWIEMNETKKVKLTRKEVVGENWYVNVGKDVMHDLGKDLHTKVAGDIFTTGAATYQLKLEKDMNAKVGADMGFDVTGKTAIKAGGDINLQSGGAGNIKTTGNLVSEAGAKLSMKATADLLMQAVNIKAKGSAEIVLEATAGIKIVCGASVITLGPAGVTIDGPLVKVNCGGGGGSAGAAESAAAAEPKAPEDAKNLEELTPGKATDYDKLFADPLAAGKDAPGAGNAAASSADASAKAKAAADAAAAAAAAAARAAKIKAAALAAAAAALAAGGAAAMGVLQSPAGMKEDEEPEGGDDAGMAKALQESQDAYDAAKADEPPPLTEEEAQALQAKAAAEAEVAYEDAVLAEEAAMTDEQRAIRAQEKAAAAAEQAAQEALPPKTAEEVQAEAAAAYAAAKNAEEAVKQEYQQKSRADDESAAAAEAQAAAQAQAALEAKAAAKLAAAKKDDKKGGGSA